MSPEDLRALALAAQNPLLAYRPGPPHEAFLRDAARFRLLRAPNQSGKTIVGAADLLWRCLGVHPFLSVPPPPLRARVICHSFDQSKVIQEKIAGLMPAGVLAPQTNYSPMLGYRHKTILFANGSKVTIHSTHQEAIALASATVGHIWIDEPPDAPTYAECTSRLVQTGGTLTATLTPVGRPLQFLRDAVEEPGSMIGETHFELSRANCPWMTEAQVAEAIRACLPGERPQRIRGEWDGVTPDRQLDGFDDDCISDTIDHDGDAMVLLGADHGERPGAEVWLLVYLWRGQDGRPHGHVWDEYASAGRTTEVQDAEHVRRMLERHGLSPYSVDRCRGDVNTAGKSQARMTVNETFERAFADMVGGKPPFKIEKPRKGPGSVVRAARVVNVAFLDRRLRVHPRCKKLIETCRHWQGDDASDLKHAFDALGYIAYDALDPTIRDRGRIAVH